MFLDNNIKDLSSNHKDVRLLEASDLRGVVATLNQNPEPLPLFQRHLLYHPTTILTDNIKTSSPDECGFKMLAMAFVPILATSASPLAVVEGTILLER